MSTLEILGGDWLISFDDENDGGLASAGLRMLEYISGPIRTTRAVYSAVAAAADEFQAMGFKNPMLPVTPNAYTMENDYFISRRSTEFLNEGAITADWGGGEIRSVRYTVTTNFVAADIGKRVLGVTSTDTGTLLDFELLPDGTNWLAWIRPDDPATDLFDEASEVIQVTSDGGTGTNTTGAASTTGTQTFSSIQVIGAVPTATEVYLYQQDEIDTDSRNKMTDQAGAFQWWVTDTTVSLGIIDILIRVQHDSNLIGDGDVEVFSRRYTSLYDNFRLNVAAGGRSALPLSSAADINNTTGDRRVTEVGATGTGPFVVGEIANEAVSGASVVITDVAGSVATPILQYYIVGDLTDLFGSGAQTLTGVTSGGTMTTAAPVVNLGGPTDTAAGEGGTVTITPGTNVADHDGDGTNEPYSIIVDAQGDVTAAKVYERIKYVCGRGRTAADLWDTLVPDVPGESYRGIEAQIQYDTPSGTWDEGDTVHGPTTYTAKNISVNTTDTYMMVTDQQTSIDVVVDNDVLTDDDTSTVEAVGSPTTTAIIKQSPLGSFTGTVLFGATGVLYINPSSGQAQNYILIDDNSVQRTPPNTVSVTITNTLALDRVLVARDTGTAGVIDKDQFGGLVAAAGGANALGDGLIEVVGPIDAEVPAAAYIRIVATGVQEEHRYVYSSRSIAADQFTLKAVTEGTGVTTGSSTQLIDTSTNFTTNGTEVGMLVRNTTASHLNQVWEVTNIVGATTIDVKPLYGSPVDWAVSDTYEINRLIGRDHAATPADYGTSDDCFDLIHDVEASGTSVTNQLVKTPAADFGVVINVRQGKIILPFTQNNTVEDGGLTATVVRAPDTIAV